jgi:hypothetical protein
MSRCIALAFSSVEAARLLISCIFSRSARMPSSSGNDVPGVGDEALRSTSSSRNCDVFALTAMFKVFLVFSLPLSLCYMYEGRVSSQSVFEGGLCWFQPLSRRALGGSEVKVQIQVSTLFVGGYVYISMAYAENCTSESHTTGKSNPRLWKDFQTTRRPLVAVIRFPVPFHHCFHVKACM